MIRLMDQNLYLGADLQPIYQDCAPTPTDLAVNGARVFQRVQQTDFPSRARTLAHTIRRADPSVLCLQEVALWRKGPAGTEFDNAELATEVVFDYLSTLLDALAMENAPFSVEIVQNTADGQLDTALGYAIRLTQRNAILRNYRVPPSVLSVTRTASATFIANSTIPTARGLLVDRRGWALADIVAGESKFRLINTHLDSSSESVRRQQIRELLDGPAAASDPVVLTGDLNSGPAKQPDASAYADLLDAGFVDVFAEDARNATWWDTENLRNGRRRPGARWDHVLTRPRFGVRARRTIQPDIWTRAANHLWPSDHAGLVVELSAIEAH
jgi:endonuclease/exonuclease/phosphatase family metal-dependent hydrolase